MSNPPEYIWLQYHGDVDPADYPDDDEGPHLSEVSWCWEKIFDYDIEYIRADEAARLHSVVESQAAQIDELEEQLAQGLKANGQLIEALGMYTGAEANEYGQSQQRTAMLEQELEELRQALVHKHGTYHGWQGAMQTINELEEKNQRLLKALVKAHEAYYLSGEPYVGDRMINIIDAVLREYGHTSPYL